jgi:hypothetical protein
MTSVNKMEMQSVQQHHFLQPGREGGRCGTNRPTEEMGIATLLEFGENDRFLTASCGPYMSHTLKLLYTFYLKRDTKDGF